MQLLKVRSSLFKNILISVEFLKLFAHQLFFQKLHQLMKHLKKSRYYSTLKKFHRETNNVFEEIIKPRIFPNLVDFKEDS